MWLMYSIYIHSIRKLTSVGLILIASYSNVSSIMFACASSINAPGYRCDSSCTSSTAARSFSRVPIGRAFVVLVIVAIVSKTTLKEAERSFDVIAYVAEEPALRSNPMLSNMIERLSS